MHVFFARCVDLEGHTIAALHALDEKCLSRPSTLYRTPVHHLLKSAALVAPLIGLFAALHKADPYALIRVDKRGCVIASRQMCGCILFSIPFV